MYLSKANYHGSAPSLIGSSFRFGNVTFAIRGSGSPGASATTKRHNLVADSESPARNVSYAIDSNGLDITKFNHTLTADPATITFDNQTILLDTSSPTISVDSHFSASGDLKIAVTPHVDLTVQIGVGAAGTLVPPKLTEFGLITSKLSPVSLTPRVVLSHLHIRLEWSVGRDVASGIYRDGVSYAY